MRTLHRKWSGAFLGGPSARRGLGRAAAAFGGGGILTQWELAPFAAGKKESLATSVPTPRATTSELPPTADIGRTCRYFREVPNPDSCTATNNSSLDDLVGTKKERLRDRQADRLGSLEIDHQRDFGRLLDGKIGRPGTVQYLIDV